MKIALIGYGKMGQAIEAIALQRGHEVVLKVSIENLEDNTIDNIRKADVAIEFTGPESAFDNIIRCIDAGVPVVSGSTGWLNRYEEVKTYCSKKNGSLLYASNFSVGVNIFFAINKKLASLMTSHPEYDVQMTEVHHTQKLDAPSGTAITLAEQILGENNRKSKWVNHNSDQANELVILSERVDPAPGTHIIRYTSAIDDIEIKHTAHSRQGFATGAVLAAEFLHTRKGIFSMSDVLGI
ncbi:4-hydroxy-tetrahydrodipicolinate reductase [Pseudobacter ginsenosidimutans]|uniref:4-hydroxy-tetrahydrodipicolinate reductase n=1 Tax=Pseudobacter ginsenosidimutans TaxID=661488 RepID=A0A4Q7MEC6_9BACT|nr:4-hydroxy-tetrahydrodipicolinate reductase [Pseudobacter ginsenosidimutans]QEC42760.1 4-hydroxy-tetrahydrodipicolinate reductase [Pseudobacter ginsenosidimutans]RZS65082.1 dihydrodipicolinate reductase [Pseudobacter ginsenosidimutans]